MRLILEKTIHPPLVRHVDHTHFLCISLSFFSPFVINYHKGCALDMLVMLEPHFDGDDHLNQGSLELFLDCFHELLSLLLELHLA